MANKKITSPNILALLFSIFWLNIHCQTAFDFSLLEKNIDSIVQEGIDSQAYPGAQVLVAQEGKIILFKTYGHHTFERKTPVNKGDLYDLASISKVTTGLPILMKLYGEGKFNLDAPLKNYFPKFKNSNKGELIIGEILAHQSQLQPYIVYWAKTIKENGKFKSRTFKNKYSNRFPIYITDNLFLHKKYKKRIYKYIKKSPLEEIKEYKYSGLFFLLLPEIISDLTGEDFETYLYKNIYQPIGATNLTYNPLNKYSLAQIVPTERDTFFRKKQIHGTVHDEAAAMLGGVSCNAGLFGNAEDLFKLFQLYLNNGKYRDEEIIPQKAVKEFTRCQFCESGNRRGLGFDKPPLEFVEGESYVAKDASPDSFGHSGFTGTFVWADPKNSTVVVFLSNRVYPTRENRKLYTMNIRPRLHQAVYDCFTSKE
jgi:CubicO group peptidase (beta-lactamase class C family)